VSDVRSEMTCTLAVDVGVGTLSEPGLGAHHLMPLKIHKLIHCTGGGRSRSVWNGAVQRSLTRVKE